MSSRRRAGCGSRSRPSLETDDEWGPKTLAGVRWLQKKVGAGVDGGRGNETEQTYIAFPQ